ncbi:hypothetical protein ACWD25_47825, partial [Streptomyces sp. NPDC002920]
MNPAPARTGTYLERLWRGQILSAGLESVLTGGSALVWYALAVLLDLENTAREPWDPDYPSARPFFLLAYATGASLVVTWALRRLPAPHREQRLRALVDRVILLR